MSNIINQQETIMNAAIKIGNSLCETAFWNEEQTRCNWMGRKESDEALPVNSSISSAALGADIYYGSSGVALFLTELYRQTHEQRFKQTALAALKRSLEYIERYPSGTSALSFFTGLLGILYSVSRLIEAEPEASSEFDTQDLLKQIEGGLKSIHYLDVISGNAGAIPALLFLSRSMGWQKCQEIALALGEEICSSAQWIGNICTFSSAGMSAHGRMTPAVTGLSHGASGIGLSLLLLYESTGNKKYLETARGAFMFEDTLFGETSGNWVDTRSPYNFQNGILTGTFAVAWCHGAPGIAVARTRASILDPENAGYHKKMAEIAIKTTSASLKQYSQRSSHDATLCHGITGLSEICMLFGRVFGDTDYNEMPIGTAEELIKRYDASGEWPSGLSTGGPSPSFMVGSSGIGYHFLKLCKPEEIPSILCMLA